jgi:hypothetical protein
VKQAPPLNKNERLTSGFWPQARQKNQKGGCPMDATGNTNTSKTNTLAIIALVVAFFVPLVGAILGHVALGQMKKSGESGRGVALAAVIIGWVFTGLSILAAILFFIPFFIFGVDVLGTL